jgi:integrase/recombinase XerD
MNEISPHNQAYLNSYLYHLKVEKGLADNTQESYRTDIEAFLSYSVKDFEQYTPKDVINYFILLQEIGLTNSSISRKRSALKSIFTFLEREDTGVSLNFEEIPKIKYGQHLPDVLNQDEMLAMLDQMPVEKPLEIRNKAMMELMYATGVRISEMLNITLHDLQIQEMLILIHGKGKKQRLIPIAEIALEFVVTYIRNARPAILKFRETDLLFVNHHGRKLSRMGFWKILQQTTLAAGIRKHITPHTIRHSFATHLLEAGANLRVVQTLLGHASLNTTQIYTNIDTSYLLETHRLYHPRG